MLDESDSSTLLLLILRFDDGYVSILQVTWYKDARRVYLDHHHVAEKHDTLAILRLKDITINDLGNYTCEAENTQGSARDHIELSGKTF